MSIGLRSMVARVSGYLLIRPFSLVLLLCVHSSAVFGQQWTLVWSDEFEYSGAPDPQKWDYDTGGGGWGNQELQYYTDRTENVRVDGSRLIIEARHEQFAGSAYTSARLVSRGKASWQYGRIEVGAMLPGGLGTWAAIWMLPDDRAYGAWPNSGEIDIMENVGYEEARVQSAVHTSVLNHKLGTNPYGAKNLPDASTAFHEYAVEWTPRAMDFFVDGDRILRFEDDGSGYRRWPFDQAFHLLLNIAVGGSWGGAQGVDPAVFPRQMAVDYVRVYQELNTLPIVTMTPAAAVVLTPGSSLTLSAAAFDPDGQLATLGFFQGDVPIGEFSGPPFEVRFENVLEGCYAVHAEAVDTRGWSSKTDPVSVTVGSVCGQAPATLAAQTVPGVVEAEHYDLGGNGVAYLELDGLNQGGILFRNDESVDVGRMTDGSGYFVGWVAGREWIEYTIDVTRGGYYRIDARLSGAGAISLELDGSEIAPMKEFAVASWSVTTLYRDVQLPAGIHVLRLRPRSSGFEMDRMIFEETGAHPSVTLDSPTTGATVPVGTPVTMTATALDPDGSIASVSFMQGIAVVATITSPPFEAVLTDALQGCYDLTAQATDDRGLTASSRSVSLRIGDACGQAPYTIEPMAIPGNLVAAWYDLGGAGVAYMDLTVQNSGGAGRVDDAVDLAFDAVAGWYITDISAREWLKYTVNVVERGSYRIDALLRTAGGGAFALSLDGVGLSGRLELASSAGNWSVQSFPAIELEAGRHELEVRMLGAGFDLARVTFVPVIGTGSEYDVPNGFSLSAPYPNPFSETTSATLRLDHAQHVRVRLIDPRGRVARILADSHLGSGVHHLEVPVPGLAAGVYLLEVQAGESRVTRKMVLVR